MGERYSGGFGWVGSSIKGIPRMLLELFMSYYFDLGADYIKVLSL
jgi:hypothetical protein